MFPHYGIGLVICPNVVPLMYIKDAGTMLILLHYNCYTHYCCIVSITTIYIPLSKLHILTVLAQHKTQGKRKADRWKIDCGRRRGEYKTLLRCPSPKTLNYYWLLLYYFNNVHIYGPIRNKSLWFGMCT